MKNQDSSPNGSRFSELNNSRGLNRSSKSPSKRKRRSSHLHTIDQDILPRFTNHDTQNSSANESNLYIGHTNSKAKHYEDLQDKFKKASRRPKIEISSDFKEKANFIDKEKITPDAQRFQLLEIRDKNGLEQLENYNETVSFGKLRKRLLRILR